MKIFNNSLGKPYFTQRNNKIKPFESCTATSIIMALYYSNIPFPMSDNQPEDDLMTFINTNPDVIHYYKNNPEPWIRSLYEKNYPANEIHSIVEYAVNLWVGKKVVSFTTNATLEQIVTHLFNKKLCVFSGNFPYEDKAGKLKTIGHVVCGVGFSTVQDDIFNAPINPNLVNNIIIDDPFGNYKTNYKNVNGNDIYMPINDFINIIKTQGSINNKWCYFINP